VYMNKPTHHARVAFALCAGSSPRLWRVRFVAAFRFATALLLVIPSTFMAADRANAQTKMESNLSAASLSSESEQHSFPGAMDKGTTEYEIWGGTSYDAPTFRQERGLKVPVLVGLRYGRIIYAKNSFALEYTIDLIPVAVVSLPGTISSSGQTNRQYAYGVGIVPVGLKAVFNRRSRFKPFVGISSGPIYFSKQVPVPGSARFNFISSGNGGIQIAKGEKHAITIGYNFSHISNAGIGQINSGFNTNYLFVGFSLFH
jgi:hypothetical protein